jgi:regulator of ribonuclease activity A
VILCNGHDCEEHFIKLNTADLSDANAGALVVDPLFVDFGGEEHFHGQVSTVKVFEDNSMVRAMLEEEGNGRVLVIDGGGSMRCALVGGALAQLAVANGWSGIIVNGCIRDSEEIRELAVGVKALGVHPRKSEKGLHAGHPNLNVTFAGVTFRTDQWLYADSDGVLVSDVALHNYA